MPAKGSSLKSGKRHTILDKKLHREFVAQTGVDIPYETFRDIIWTTCQLIHDSVADEEAGVELPEGLGHLVVTKYKSKKIPTDWVNSKRLKKKVPLLNLHSFGYIHHIKWFKMNTRFRNRYIYKFQPYRTLSRRVAHAVKGGKKYHKWENSDFWSTTRMERAFSKFFKTTEP